MTQAAKKNISVELFFFDCCSVVILFCEAQIDQSDSHLFGSVQVKHHVVWFDVVVDTATLVYVLKDSNHLYRQFQHLVGTLQIRHTFEMLQGCELILFHYVETEVV